MRVRKKSKGLTVNAVAGTYVVFFGLDLAPEVRAGFRGFAFKRHDAKEDETLWMRGMKTFESTEPYPAKGETFSTREHPVQSFQWADYGAKPGRAYTYTVHALYGSPDNLESRISVDIEITAETETGPFHSAFFNRGSVATQEYARRFQNEEPSKVGPGAYEWLSRGLLEALIAFLQRAGKGWSIHGAVYELQWPPVLHELRAAKKRGATVKILFDDIEGYDKKRKPKGPWSKNRAALAAAKIKSICAGRGNGKLMHNKFFVLSRGGSPVAVWTGSTNLTENGIFGHSNVGHIVEDAAVAQAFLSYWGRLKGDPAVDPAYQSANEAASPSPPKPWSKSGTTTVFSPRTNLAALEWYAKIASSAKAGLFMTFAFGMHKDFKAVFSKEDQVLRMALLEKAGNNPNTLEQDKRDIQRIRNLPNVVIAMGNRIVTNAFDRWLAEMSKLNPNVHVYWIHTKYMLVDPLSANPTVVSGSANFSKASTDTNDENMLVILGDKRVTDIYFGEYHRLYAHYAFREVVKWHLEKGEDPKDWRPQYLIDDDEWMSQYFDPNDTTARFSRREYFAGPMSV